MLGCAYACLVVCIHMPGCLHACQNSHASQNACMLTNVYVCTTSSMHACRAVWMHVGLHACMSGCVHETRMYTCMPYPCMHDARMCTRTADCAYVWQPVLMHGRLCTCSHALNVHGRLCMHTRLCTYMSGCVHTR